MHLAAVVFVYVSVRRLDLNCLWSEGCRAFVGG